MQPAIVQWSADEFAQAFADELPTGTAWPRDPDAGLMPFVQGEAQIWGDVSARSADLLVDEADPRSTLEMLSDWERAFGLPDPCLGEAQTLVDRRRALVNKITTLGGQSRPFFIAVAAALGYTITITEFSPFMCGISRCGDTRPAVPADPTDVEYRWQVGPPEIRFWWRVNVLGTKTRWFRAGSGQCGVDPMVRIGLATDLECLIRRWKPAHTDVVFSYARAGQQVVAYKWFRAGQGHVGTDPMLTITAQGGIADT